MGLEEMHEKQGIWSTGVVVLAYLSLGIELLLS
jgi:hypothetical protein